MTKTPERAALSSWRCAADLRRAATARLPARCRAPGGAALPFIRPPRRLLGGDGFRRGRTPPKVASRGCRLASLIIRQANHNWRHKYAYEGVPSEDHGHQRVVRASAGLRSGDRVGCQLTELWREASPTQLVRSETDASRSLVGTPPRRRETEAETGAALGEASGLERITDAGSTPATSILAPNLAVPCLRSGARKRRRGGARYHPTERGEETKTR